MRTSDGRMSLKSTSSAVSRDRISCTTAMLRTRRSDSSRACRASPVGMRRDCSRSRDEIVCRLFLTR